MEEKVFVGNCKTITTQYGNMTGVGFKEEDLKMLLEKLNGGWVNLTLKHNKEGKPYLELNQYNGGSTGAKKEKSDTVKQTKRDIEDSVAQACTSDDDLPF